MPYIDVKLSVKSDENKKNELQSKLTDAAAVALSKPKPYIMINIEDEKSLYMAGKQMNNGAYVSVSLFGAASKNACLTLTKNICEILASEYGTESSNVYVTYHPLDLWGWNGSMF